MQLAFRWEVIEFARWKIGDCFESVKRTDCVNLEGQHPHPHPAPPLEGEGECVELLTMVRVTKGGHPVPTRS
ncbi:hypothetical protein GMSM_19440 [Geomonas sp. Red276]